MILISFCKHAETAADDLPAFIKFPSLSAHQDAHVHLQRDAAVKKGGDYGGKLLLCPAVDSFLRFMNMLQLLVHDEAKKMF